VKELKLAAMPRRKGELLAKFMSGDRQVMWIQEAKGAVENQIDEYSKTMPPNATKSKPT